MPLLLHEDRSDRRFDPPPSSGGTKAGGREEGGGIAGEKLVAFRFASLATVEKGNGSEALLVAQWLYI